MLGPVLVPALVPVLEALLVPVPVSVLVVVVVLVVWVLVVVLVPTASRMPPLPQLAAQQPAPAWTTRSLSRSRSTLASCTRWCASCVWPNPQPAFLRQRSLSVSRKKAGRPLCVAKRSAWLLRRSSRHPHRHTGSIRSRAKVAVPRAHACKGRRFLGAAVVAAVAVVVVAVTQQGGPCECRAVVPGPQRRPAW